MLAATRHTPLICAAESLARATFADILPAGDGWVSEVVALRKEFGTLVRLESCRYEALRRDLKKWRDQVRCGQIDFDPSREDDFKGALRALVALEDFLIGRFDAYNQKGLLLAKTRFVAVMQSHMREAQGILDSWKSPEWETTHERVVKWDKDQTRHLRDRLDSCK